MNIDDEWLHPLGYHLVVEAHAIHDLNRVQTLGFRFVLIVVPNSCVHITTPGRQLKRKLSVAPQATSRGEATTDVAPLAMGVDVNIDVVERNVTSMFTYSTNT